MPAEFDAYAETYANRLKDPIRDVFADDGQFFAKRKLLLVLDFFRRHQLDTQKLQWVDLGCGQGELIRLAQAHFAAVAGCEPSAEMMGSCSDLNVRHQATPEKVPFDDNAFNFATAVCVYHHVASEMRAALTREAMRILKPGGIFCIMEHNPFNPVTQLIVRRSPIDTQAQLLSTGKARRLARSAGGQIIETRYFLYFPERMYRNFARVEDQLAGVCAGGQYAVFARKT